MAVLDRWDAVQAELAELSFAALTPAEVLDIKDRLECGYRRQATVDHRLTRELTCQASPIDLGGKSFTDVLSTRLRISKDEARRRLQEAEDLAPRTALSGAAGGAAAAEHRRRAGPRRHRCRACAHHP